MAKKREKVELPEVMAFLAENGNESTKKTLIKHGAREPFFGVKVGDMKKLVRRIKEDHALSLELYATGNSDAMYFAGLIAEPSVISESELDTWVDGAYWYYLSEFTVASVAAESPHGRTLALRWMDRPEEHVAAAGWSTDANIVGVRPDEDLDLGEIGELLKRCIETVHSAQNRTRHTMNGFVVAVGTFVEPLQSEAYEAGKAIGRVSVDMGGTACKVPLITAYIDKVRTMGRTGKKRKNARC
jgi:3-methyladenine DNA glycosylase AlkD